MTTNGATGGANREAKGAPGTGVAGYSRELLRGALTYAGRGIPVFPCEPGGKRPLTADGFFEATTDEARIRGWWGRWPNANVAIPTGVRSGLLVLDVDTGEGTDSVALLELSCGQSPKTARAATGGGGAHLYFRYPFPARALGSRPVHAGGEEQPGSPRGRPGCTRRGRLRRCPAQQHGANLPVDRSVASGRRLLAARVPEGGHLGRDTILTRNRRLR